MLEKYKDTKNATLSYYKGFIRELGAKLDKALIRISELEKQIRKIHQNNPVESDDINSMSSEQEAILYPENEVASLRGAGLTEADIRKIVNDAIEANTLKIPIHDHTAIDKGGYCFANLGATLQ